MDVKTRLILSWDVSPFKMNYDASRLFGRTAQRAGCLPAILVSNRLHAFGKAFRKIFYRKRSPRPIHFGESHMRGEFCNNNAHERLNRTIANYISNTRGLQKIDSMHISSFMILYNFIRPHTGLGRVTPASAAGIHIDGVSSWHILIPNAVLAAS